MGYLLVRYNYHFSALVFSASVMTSCVAHADPARDARQQQLVKEIDQLESEYQEKYNQIVAQITQNTKDVDRQISETTQWNNEQSYKNEQKCTQLLQQDTQNGGAQCESLRRQLSAEYSQKIKQLDDKRSQQISQAQQQEEDVAHDKNLKEERILTEIKNLY